MVEVKVKAKDIIKCLSRYYSRAAFVTELTMTDDVVMAVRREVYAKRSRYSMTDEQLAVFLTPQDRRIDLLMYNSNTYTAIEIKVSYADFKRETEEKRRGWQSVTDRFVYVCPPNVIPVAEVPKGCGLWYVDVTAPWYEQVKIVKRATINKNRLPFPERLIKILMYRAMRVDKSR